MERSGAPSVFDSSRVRLEPSSFRAVAGWDLHPLHPLHLPSTPPARESSVAPSPPARSSPRPAQAVAQAKESGELVALRRSRVAALKEALKEEAGSEPSGAGGAGGGALRGRLEAEKEGYKEEVALLRSLKGQIEAIQGGLDASQRQLQE